METLCVVSGNDFYQAVRNLRGCMATKPGGRYAIQGIHLKPSQQSATASQQCHAIDVVATDAYKLVITTLRAEEPMSAKEGVIMDAEFVARIAKCGQVKRCPLVEIKRDKNTLFMFRRGCIVQSGGIMEGVFPNYHAVVPAIAPYHPQTEEVSKLCTVKLKDLLQAMVAIKAAYKNIAPTGIVHENGRLHIHSDNTGWLNVETSEYTKHELSHVQLDAQHAVPMLKALGDADEVTVYLPGCNERPLLLTTDHVRAVIMPLVDKGGKTDYAAKWKAEQRAPTQPTAAEQAPQAEVVKEPPAHPVAAPPKKEQDGDGPPDNRATNRQTIAQLDKNCNTQSAKPEPQVEVPAARATIEPLPAQNEPTPEPHPPAQVEDEEENKPYHPPVLEKNEDGLPLVECPECRGTGIAKGLEQWTLKSARERPQEFNRASLAAEYGEAKVAGGQVKMLCSDAVSPIGFRQEDGRYACRKCHGKGQIVEPGVAKKQWEKRKADAAKRAEDAAASQKMLEAKKPRWATRVILAECERDQCDLQSDYFGTSVERCVAIGWLRGPRADFAQMRKAAATFDATKHLANGPKTQEHRENYSMGAGYYLKAGPRYSTGWLVRARKMERLGGIIIEDRLPDTAQPNATDEASTAIAQGNVHVTVSKYHHDKKDADYWLVTPAERQPRAQWEQLVDAAKQAGGWYARPWQNIPHGYGFPTIEQAHAFAKKYFDIQPEDASAKTVPQAMPVVAAPELAPTQKPSVSSNITKVDFTPPGRAEQELQKVLQDIDDL